MILLERIIKILILILTMTNQPGPLLPPATALASVRVPAHTVPSQLDVAPLPSVQWLRYVAGPELFAVAQRRLGNTVPACPMAVGS